MYCITNVYIKLLRDKKYFLELTHILVLNDLIKSTSYLFKSASNAFFLASFVFLRLQLILPRIVIIHFLSNRHLKKFLFNLNKRIKT